MGEDFFDANQFPEAILKIKSSQKITGSTYAIIADLTLKGKTLPIEFNAEVNPSDNGINTKAEITVNRAKYDIKYKSKTFFPELGDKFIHDDFVLKIDLDLPKQNS
jgi:polyisoprenoid-binding protein YceI